MMASARAYHRDGRRIENDYPAHPGQEIEVRVVDHRDDDQLDVAAPNGWRTTDHARSWEVKLRIGDDQVEGAETIPYRITRIVDDADPDRVTEGSLTVWIAPETGTNPTNGKNTPDRVWPEPPLPVTLVRSSVETTNDQCLWSLIRRGSQRISFREYDAAMTALCGGELSTQNDEEARVLRLFIPGFGSVFSGSNAYVLLKAATEAFLISRGPKIGYDDPHNRNSNLHLVNGYIRGHRDDRLPDSFCQDEPQEIPYLSVIADRLGFKSIADGTDFCSLVADQIRMPYLVELIWSYWQEEGMLVQTMNAITARFQNVIPAGLRNGLENFELGALRPLNGVIWAKIQDEQHQLSLPRRVQEYDHHYGLRLQGRAVSRLKSADSRSKFIEAFHNLLASTIQFYRQDDDTTVVADGFPLLNSLRDVHLLLSMGAHNQFGDLPVTARVEMMMQQWILSRPEIDRFLPSREMVAYPEKWMGPVDTMKGLQGWTDVSAMQFGRLANYGEQILLSVRYGHWLADGLGSANAVNWARYWRNEVQGYVHAYRATTGVDLTADPVDTAGSTERYLQPSFHLFRRLTHQNRRPAAVGSTPVMRPLTTGPAGARRHVPASTVRGNRP